jgi:hypothetical protein
MHMHSYVLQLQSISFTKSIHNFRDWCCHLVNKITLDLLAIITLESVTFRSYGKFPALLPFLNASWKSCSVRTFCSACDSMILIHIYEDQTSIVKNSSYIFGSFVFTGTIFLHINVLHAITAVFTSTYFVLLEVI